MLTKNYYHILRQHFLRGVEPNGVTDINGTVCDCGCCRSAQSNDLLFTGGGSPSAPLPLAFGSYPGIVIGSGTTPATYHDYKLENMITSGLSATRVYADGKTRITLTNNSGGDITIGEIGVQMYSYTTALSTSNNETGRKVVLVERTVLDSPMTIPNGGSGVIDYEITTTIPE